MLMEMNLKINFNRILNIIILLVISTFFVIIFVLKIEVPCIFKSILGISCPGCGMTRAVNEILNLNFIQAFKYNILSIPLAIIGTISIIIIVYDIIFNQKIFISSVNRILTKYWHIVLVVVSITIVINNINRI